MKDIRIDEPGAGEWLMERVGGSFNDKVEHSIAHYGRDGQILGGFVISNYLGGSVSVHMAGDDPRWCSRELLFMVFHYIFRQLRCHKAFAPVASDNHKALELDIRAGWRIEGLLRDAYAPGRHMFILAMTVAECRWLGLSLQQCFMGDVGRRLHHG